jgi:hypothetical protein
MLNEDGTEITDENITSILIREEGNDKITYVTRGGGGVIMSLTKIDDSDYPFVINRSNYANRKINSLLIKFVFITPREGMYEEYQTSTQDIFLQELGIQREIFRASSDKYLEPLVPQILFATIYGTGGNPHHFLTEILERKKSSGMNERTSSTIDYIIDICAKQSVSIGLIVMEHMSDFQPASSYFFHQGIKTPSDSDYRFDYDDDTDFYNQRLYYCMLYTIYQLALLGFVHGDLHLGNLLINPSYTYFNGYLGVVKLIDFGRTKYVGPPRDIHPLNLFKFEWDNSEYDYYKKKVGFTGYNWFNFNLTHDDRMPSKILGSLGHLNERREQAKRLFDEHIARCDAHTAGHDTEKDDGKMVVVGGTKNVYDNFDPEFIFTTQFINNYVRKSNVFLDKLIKTFKSSIKNPRKKHVNFYIASIRKSKSRNNRNTSKSRNNRNASKSRNNRNTSKSRNNRNTRITIEN